MTTIGRNYQSGTSRSLDQNAPSPGISDGETSSKDSQPLEDTFENPWSITLPPNTGTPLSEPSTSARTPSWREYSTTRTGTSIPHPRDHGFTKPAYERQRSSESWRMPSDPLLHARTIGYGMLSPVSSPEGFRYDPQIFGWFPSQNPEEVPDFYMHGIDPLPDSPPSLIR